MNIKIMNMLLIVAATLVSSSTAYSQAESDERMIKKVITQFSSGVDQQSGHLILSSFRDGAGFYATNNRDKVLSVTPTKLADLHEAKKFGGRDRELNFEQLDITDGIVATVKVIAQDEKVFYVYYMNLSKIDDSWLIQSVLQHSKMK